MLCREGQIRLLLHLSHRWEVAEDAVIESALNLLRCGDELPLVEFGWVDAQGLDGEGEDIFEDKLQIVFALQLWHGERCGW